MYRITDHKTPDCTPAYRGTAILVQYSNSNAATCSILIITSGLHTSFRDQPCNDSFSLMLVCSIHATNTVRLNSSPITLGYGLQSINLGHIPGKKKISFLFYIGSVYAASCSMGTWGRYPGANLAVASIQCRAISPSPPASCSIDASKDRKVRVSSNSTVTIAVVNTAMSGPALSTRD